MKSIRQQMGMTAIGWIFVIALVVTIAIVLIKLVPVYMGGFSMYQTLDSLKTDNAAHGKSALELRKMLLKRLDVSMVKDVKSQDITFSRNKGNIIVEVDYEARRQLFGNLYAVVVFNKSVEIPSK